MLKPLLVIHFSSISLVLYQTFLTAFFHYYIFREIIKMVVLWRPGMFQTRPLHKRHSSSRRDQGPGANVWAVWSRLQADSKLGAPYWQAATDIPRTGGGETEDRQVAGLLCSFLTDLSSNLMTNNPTLKRNTQNNEWWKVILIHVFYNDDCPSW